MTDRRARFLLLLGVLCWLPAWRAKADPGDEPHRHLGVQLRALAGPALLYGFQDVGRYAPGTTHGVGFGVDVALGQMLSETLALDMDLAFARSASAEHGTLTHTAFNAVFLGGGLTYWLMPANVYLAASLGLSRSSVQGSTVHLGIDVPNPEQSRVGPGAHLALGKQFWLSQRVGLGASLSLLTGVSGNPSGGADTNRYLLALMLALTASLH